MYGFLISPEQFLDMLSLMQKGASTASQVARAEISITFDW
jgi:hypothetical protein